MIEKYVVCDECGDDNMIVHFSDTGLLITESDVSYGDVQSEGVDMVRISGKGNWWRHYRPCEEDAIAICSRDYCSECHIEKAYS